MTQTQWAALAAARKILSATDTIQLRAAGLGIEPRIPAPKAGVLPLHYPAIFLYNSKNYEQKQ